MVSGFRGGVVGLVLKDFQLQAQVIRVFGKRPCSRNLHKRLAWFALGWVYQIMRCITRIVFRIVEVATPGLREWLLHGSLTFIVLWLVLEGSPRRVHKYV